MSLVLSIIKRFTNRGKNIDDIFQVGCIGLIKAIDNFDTSHGDSFQPMQFSDGIVLSKYSKMRLQMTRKQALQAVILFLEKEEKHENYIEIVKNLKLMDELLPYQKWNIKNIQDTLTHFYRLKGRIPKVIEIDRKNKNELMILPSRTAIVRHYKMTMGELKKYFIPNKGLTGKEAIQLGIELIKNSNIDKKESVLSGLKIVDKTYPFTTWSESAVFDAFNQFYIENGYNATSSDMKDNRNLPSHPVIRNRFKLSAKTFLDSFFPTEIKSNSKVYFFKSKEEWLANFIKQYNERKPSNDEDYNLYREANTPSWITIARLFGMETWGNLKKFADVESYDLDGNVVICDKSEFKVSRVIRK